MGRASAVRANTKAKTDAAKTKTYGQFAKKIIMAVKAGGAKVDSNRILAQIISDAKSANVPKDIITRNIEKASSTSSVDYKETIYEFYGHGGVGFIVNVLTDNDNRASADVNLVAKKNLLKPAALNSVSFKFGRKARIDIQAIVEEETMMTICLESGIDDFLLRTTPNGCILSPNEEGKSTVYVDVKYLGILRDVLQSKNYKIETKLAHIPLDGFITLSDADFDANSAAIFALESLDDVDSVEHNIDMTVDDN